MVQHWSPMSQVMRAITPGEWFVFDDGKKIAVIRELKLGRRKETMFRVVTYAEASADRVLIGYFPHMDMAAEITWREYLKSKRR